MIWIYCPECGAPMISVTAGWICMNSNCGCKRDIYGNQYVETIYSMDYSYEVDKNPKEVRPNGCRRSKDQGKP